MKNFSFGIPQDIRFGCGIIEALPQIIKEYKFKKLFLISDRGLQKAGLVDKITKILTDNSLPYEAYLDVVANPTNVVVDEATAKFKEAQADCILALGGGSPMDTSKAVSILALYGGEIMDYEAPTNIPGDTLPIIAIPTTAGTGSEVTSAAVFTNVENGWKFAVRSNKLLPKVSLLDPQMITGLPPFVAASTGVDALVHAIESYTSKNCNPYSAAMSEKAMELIGGNLRKFVADRSNIEAASNMLLGSTFAGLAFANVALGNVHAMSHPISGHLGVAHGVANAILLPAVLKYNALGAEDKYEKIYNYIKGKRLPDNISFENDMLYDEVYKLLIDMNIPTHLSMVGVTEDILDILATDAMKSGNIKVNPRTSNKEDVINIYKSAL